MLEELNNIFNNEDILEMRMVNPYFEFDENTIDNILLLENIGCDRDKVRSIGVVNPFYLSNIYDDNLKFIKRMIDIGFRRLDILFYDNPFILNKSINEIDKFIESKISMGKNIDEIINIVYDNPYVM